MKGIIKKFLKRFLFAIWRRIPTCAFLQGRLEHSPVCLPWFKMRGKQDTVNRIHRLALELKRSQTRWAAIKGGIVWPLLSCIRALYEVHRYGIWTKRRYRRNLWEQWKQMVYLANVYNLPSHLYYHYGLWEDSKRRNADQYFQIKEHIILIDWLNRNVDTKRIDNKYSFFEFCRNADIPTPPIIASFDRSGTEKWLWGGCEFPKVDLVIKPANLALGIGVERWEYVEVCHKWKRAYSSLNHSELLDYCRQRAQKGQVIVQPRLWNHPSVEQFSNGTLCTLRVVSYHLPGNKPRLLQSCFRMPVGMAEADNFQAGGIATEVSDSGKLGVAVNKDVSKGIFTHHPDTQAKIQDVQLPYWQQMVDLALLAHERLGSPCFVGWDMALTKDGPMVLEGNDKFGVDLAQIPQGQPLGETRYGEIFIAAAEATNPAPLLKKILLGEPC